MHERELAQPGHAVLQPALLPDASLETFPEATRICVVYAGDEPAGAAFDGLHGDTIEGMWLGAKAKYRNRLVGYVLYWELIKNACEGGFTRFHLGRSTADSGGEAFKKKWNAVGRRSCTGTTSCPTARQMPALNVDNPRYQHGDRRVAAAAARRDAVHRPVDREVHSMSRCRYVAPAGAPIGGAAPGPLGGGDGRPAATRRASLRRRRSPRRSGSATRWTTCTGRAGADAC